MIKTIKDITVLDNGFLKVNNDLVEFPNKQKGNYFKMSTSDKLPNYCVAGLVITTDNKIILMDNYRYAHRDYNIETVKGLGMSGKTPLETFKIELKEEIGGSYEEIEEQNFIQGDSQDFPIYVFHATGVKQEYETEHEETEFIQEIHAYTEDEVKTMIKEGIITDVVTLSILGIYFLNK